MPKGVPIRESIPCAVCGKLLTKKQISRARCNGRTPTYCSYQCAKGRMKPFDSLQEPELTVKGVERFEETIRKRKERLDLPELAMIRAQTPSDDSPEAEKRLRQRICPNPPAYIYASGTTNDGPANSGK